MSETTKEPRLMAQCMRCRHRFEMKILECPICGNDNENQFEYMAVDEKGHPL